MKGSQFRHHFVGVYAAIAMLAGCAGAPTGIGARHQLLPYIANWQHTDHGISWMVKGAAAIRKLLYVSDINTDDVFVYNYSTGTQVGQLAGFNYPQGQCVDKRGDIWIANFANGGSPVSVVEYAHGGTNPIATIVPEGNPIGCSVDPITGSLAVANRTIPNQTHGDIEIWRTPSRKPTKYVNLYCGLLTSPGFDNKGNLYVEGALNGHPPNKVCEIPAGGTALETVQIMNGAVHGANGVMWDGKYIGLSDSNPFNQSNSSVTAIYQAVPKKPTAGSAPMLKIVGTTILTDDCFYGRDDSLIWQPFVVGRKNTPNNDEQGTVVIGGNLVCSARFDFWSYPAGGFPDSSLESPPPHPEGQSVSIAE